MLRLLTMYVTSGKGNSKCIEGSKRSIVVSCVTSETATKCRCLLHGVCSGRFSTSLAKSTVSWKTILQTHSAARKNSPNTLGGTARKCFERTVKRRSMESDLHYPTKFIWDRQILLRYPLFSNGYVRVTRLCMYDASWDSGGLSLDYVCWSAVCWVYTV